MSKGSIALLLTLVFLTASCVMTGKPVWVSSEMSSQNYEETVNDVAYSLVATSDGGFALAGITRLLRGLLIETTDCWLVKSDAIGNMKWNRTYGEAGAYSLIETSDGRLAIAGFGVGFSDFWLVKTDAYGNMEWNQTYGGAGIDSAYSLVATSDGGFALAGSTFSFGAGYADFWLVKTDAYGVVEWNQTYGTAGYDVAYSLVATSDGGFALAGITRLLRGLLIETTDCWLVKSDAIGNMKWNRTYGEAGAYSLIETSDGRLAIAGFGVGFSDFWLVKTDAYGNMEWNQTYGGAGIDCARSLVQTSDGGFALAGSTVSYGVHGADFWLVKTDAYGNMEWSQTYGRAMPPPEPTPTPEPQPTDSTPPEIKVLSPVNQTYNESSVSLVFTVNEPFNWTGYSLNGEENVTVMGNVTLTDLSNGLHNVTVYANDTFGNMGVSETINFAVAVPELEPEPFPVVPVAAVSAVIAVMAAGLLVYFKKRKH